MKALHAMIRKEFLHIGRDPQLVAFILGLPILLLILFGYALRLKVDHMRIAVWDQDQNFFSVAVTDRLRLQGHFTVLEVGSEAAIRELLKTNQARLGLIIPKGFAERLVNDQPTNFTLFVDGTMPTLAQAALYSAGVLTGEDAAKALRADDPEHPPPPFRKPPIRIERTILYNPELRDSDFFLPGTIGIVIMIVVLTLSSGLVKEKEQATIEQLLVTPIPRLTLIAGKMIPYGLVGAFDFGLVSVLAVLIFRLPLLASLMPTTLLAVLFIFSLLALGALMSTLARTQLQANFMSVFVIVPSVLMSGFVFPIEAIPGWLQPVAWCLPMTYFTEAIRGLVLKGASIADQARDFLVLFAFMIAFTVLSLARFRKQLA